MVEDSDISEIEGGKFHRRQKQLGPGTSVTSSNDNAVSTEHAESRKSYANDRTIDVDFTEVDDRKPYHDSDIFGQDSSDWRTPRRANTSSIHKETRGERVERKGRGLLNDVVAFRDDLYGYPVHDRGERLDQASRGKRLSRNTGKSASSPVGDINFFGFGGGSWLNPVPVGRRAPSAKKGKKERGSRRAGTCAIDDPMCVPDSLIDLF